MFNENISELIKLTQSDNTSSNDDEIIYIATFVNNTDINKNNIHCILKLIANLTKYQIIYDSENITFDLNNLIHLANLTKLFDESISSDSELDEIESFADGDIISLVNIYCSKKYNDFEKAYKLINIYNIHKTSSYIPIFQLLIRLNDLTNIKKLYYQYIKKNKSILEYNIKIKEVNHQSRLYNEKIKLMKKKFNELTSINEELSKINIKNNSAQKLSSLILLFDNNDFKEHIIYNEKIIITIPNNIIKDIILIAINHNDDSFINDIIVNINIPTNDLIAILNIYFSKKNYEYIYSNINDGVCMCCNNVLQCCIISDEDRANIMLRIDNKIRTTSCRNDNGLNLNKIEKQLIIDKWEEYLRLLEINDFDIVIDGANLGYINTKNNDINIKLIQSTINETISKSKKKILLIIHQRHINKIKHLPINKYVTIYATPNNVNDDLFWLYASIYCKCFILSNDQSRDHGYMVSYQTEIKKWTSAYQIKINNDTTRLLLPDVIYTNKQSIISPGINITDNVIHIVLNMNKNICVHTSD